MIIKFSKTMLFLTFCLVFTVNIFSTQFFQNNPVSTISGMEAYPFERIELLVDNSSEFFAQKYHPENKINHSALLSLTEGEGTLHSGYFFLHYSEGWDKETDKNPVLLVHGAGDTAYRGFAHPFEEEIKPGEHIEYFGLGLELPMHDYPTFSITFAHPHGCNIMQAEHIANAVKRIQKVTGRENDPDFKVDLIAHSKGGVASRVYMSDLGKYYDEYSWITPYRNDIERFFAVAVPLNGVDAQYRYYGMNLMAVDNNMPSPLGTDSILYYGVWKDLKNNYKMFPGQDQILNDLVNDPDTPVGFSNLSMTSDMNFSRNVLYNGGTSAFLTSSGIQHAIKRGGNLIQKLNNHGIHPDIDIHVLAGNDNQIDDNIEFWFDLLPVGEKIAPSDMLLFVKSATYTDGLIKRGAEVKTKKVIPFNHMNIIFHREAKEIIVDLLNN
ncbi:MAG: esterase/lipase family protein [Candidatus Muiribacteriota bacterium]